jgi:hypothetical protein
MNWIYDDGGRAEAGFRGHTGDCVARAVAIASGRPYREVYVRLAEGNAAQRATARTPKRGRTARSGICVGRKWFKDYMRELGFRWVPTMAIGTGTRVHLADGELPDGRLVVQVSKHYTAVIDGTIHDTYDPQRRTAYMKAGPDGRAVVDHVSDRAVYGYYILEGGTV